MEFLTIGLLGVPEVRLGDQPVSMRTRKVLALLIYLAVEPDPSAKIWVAPLPFRRSVNIISDDQGTF